MPTTVQFADADATDVVVVSDTELSVTVPPGSLGLVDVTVSTAGGEYTAVNAFEYVDSPQLNVIVPDEAGGATSIAVPYDTPTIYVTRLQNFGTEATDVTDEVRLHSDGVELAEGDVVLEAEQGGGGSWIAEPLTVDDGDLVSSDVLATVAAGMNSRGRMRITVADTVPDLVGTSTLSDVSGTLATTTYTFDLTGGA